MTGRIDLDTPFSELLQLKDYPSLYFHICVKESYGKLNTGKLLGKTVTALSGIWTHVSLITSRMWWPLHYQNNHAGNMADWSLSVWHLRGTPKGPVFLSFSSPSALKGALKIHCSHSSNQRAEGFISQINTGERTSPFALKGALKSHCIHHPSNQRAEGFISQIITSEKSSSSALKEALKTRFGHSSNQPAEGFIPQINTGERTSPSALKGALKIYCIHPSNQRAKGFIPQINTGEKNSLSALKGALKIHCSRSSNQRAEGFIPQINTGEKLHPPLSKEHSKFIVVIPRTNAPKDSAHR